jgi:hypothetical protein
MELRFSYVKTMKVSNEDGRDIMSVGFAPPSEIAELTFQLKPQVYVAFSATRF